MPGLHSRTLLTAAALGLACAAGVGCSLLLPVTNLSVGPADGGDAGDGGDAEADDADDADVRAEADLDVAEDAEADADPEPDVEVDEDAETDADGDTVIPPRGPVVEHDFQTFDGDLVEDIAPLSPHVQLEVVHRTAGDLAFHRGAAILDGGFLRATAGASEELVATLLPAPGFSVAAWIETTVDDQTGPARIVTLSHDAYIRAFTIGQEGDDLIVRFRTTATTDNGEMPDGEGGHRNLHITDHFFPTAAPTLVVLVWDGATGTSSLWINTTRSSDEPHEDPGGGPASLNWEPTGNRLGLGDEFRVTGTDRRWAGSVHHLAIYDRALTETEIAEIYWLGPEP